MWARVFKSCSINCLNILIGRMIHDKKVSTWKCAWFLTANRYNTESPQNIIAKYTVYTSGKFLKALGALNKRPARNGTKKFQNAWFQKYNFLSSGPPLCSELCKFHWKWHCENWNDIFWTLGTHSGSKKFSTFASLKSFTS